MAKKKKSPKAASAPLASKKTRKQKARGKDGEPQAEESLDNLPDNVLLRIFIKAGYEGRLTAMQVCKHFKAVATHPIFTRTVEPGKTIMEVVKQARAGDTLIIPPGLYDVSSFILSPGHHRCYFENMVFRSSIATGNRSICAFGAGCDYMRFDNCEFSGMNGLTLPRALARTTKLILIGCQIHSVSMPLCAILMETGILRMEGCTISSCFCAVDAASDSLVYLKNNDLSFNDNALNLQGKGVFSDNIVWGNVRQYAIEIESSDVYKEEEVEPRFDELVAKHLAQQPAEGDGEAQQPAEGGSQEVEGHLKKPRFYIRNNHIQAAGRKRDRSESEAAVRKRIRQLAVATYGQHEHEDWMGDGMGEDHWTDEEDDFDDWEDNWEQDIPEFPEGDVDEHEGHWGAGLPEFILNHPDGIGMAEDFNPHHQPIVLSDSESDTDSNESTTSSSSSDSSDEDGWDSDDGPMPPWAGGPPMPHEMQAWDAGAGEGGDHSDDESSLNDAMEIEEQQQDSTQDEE